MDATVALIAAEGISAVTVRRIAAKADVNQALVSYHFGGLTGLLRASYRQATSRLVADFERDFAGVSSFDELHQVGVRIAERARADGSAAVLAQVLAAGFHDQQQAVAISESLLLWREATHDAIVRVLERQKFAGVVDAQQLSNAVTAAVIGMLVVDCLEPAPLGQTLPSLGGLVRLVDRAVRLMPAALARRVLG